MYTSVMWPTAVSSALTMYSMLEAGGWTWPRSLLCKSRMRCMSPSLMALFPLDLALHHSSSLSEYLSRMDSSFVELVRTMARTVWVKHRNKLAALTQPGKGRDLSMTGWYCCWMKKNVSCLQKGVRMFEQKRKSFSQSECKLALHVNQLFATV